MFYTTYPYGHDCGNTETSGYTILRSGEKVLTLSSALHRGSYDELIRQVGATSSNDGEISILNSQSHAIKFRDQEGREQELFVGELAISQAGNTTMDILTGRGQMQRYWDYRSLALLLSCSGSMIPDTEYGLMVVTNIPVSSHTETNVKRVKAALEGSHHFTLNGRKRVAHVQVKKTIMEGSAAAILCGNGKSKIGVVDIGGRTTDVYMVSGLVPVQDLCKSFDIGVESASDRIKNRFEERFEWPISVHDTRALLYAHLQRSPYATIPSVLNSGAPDREVDHLVHQILREVGQSIAGSIRGMWNQSFKSTGVAGDVSMIVGIGGGAYYFREELEGLFRNRLHIPAQPERVNARGCLHLAKHYMEKNPPVTKVVGQ